MSNVLDLIHTAETNPPAAPLRAGSMAPEVEGYEDEQDPAVKGAWAIESLGSADWALSRLADGEAEIAEIERQEAATIARVHKRADELKARAGRLVSFMRYKLLAYAETHRAALITGKKKSRDFIHGRIGWRQKGGRLVVEDKAELEAWLLTQPVEAGLYRFKVEPEIKAIQAQFKADGVIPPGMKFEPEYEDIEIKASGPETALVKGDGNV